MHQMELKKEQGEEIKPEEFSPSETAPYPKPPWEKGAVEDEGGIDGAGDLAVKTDPDPPPSFLDDEHPLAGNYRLPGWLTLQEAWFLSHHRGLVCHLMRREPNLEIPEEKKADA